MNFEQLYQEAVKKGKTSTTVHNACIPQQTPQLLRNFLEELNENSPSYVLQLLNETEVPTPHQSGSSRKNLQSAFDLAASIRNDSNTTPTDSSHSLTPSKEFTDLFEKVYKQDTLNERK